MGTKYVSFFALLGLLSLCGCGTERDHCRESIMSFYSAQAMMSDENLNIVQLDKSQEKEMMSLIRSGIKQAALVSDEYLDSIHPRMREEFRNHLVKGWSMYLSGLEQQGALSGFKPQVDGIRLVKKWQAFKEEQSNLLFERVIRNR